MTVAAVRQESGRLGQRVSERAGLVVDRHAHRLERARGHVQAAGPHRAGHRAADGRHQAASITVNTRRLSGYLQIWDVRTGASERSFGGGLRDSLESVTLSPDGKLLAMGNGTVVRLWNPETGQQVRALEGHTSTISAVAFSPDGKLLATGAADKTVRLWPM